MRNRIIFCALCQSTHPDDAACKPWTSEGSDV